MKERQKLLLKELLQTKTPLNIKNVAEKLNCSGRTIRNDLKVLDRWFTAHSPAEVILKRQPGVGIYLQADTKTKEKLLQLMKEYQTALELENQARQDQILFQLLMNQDVMTIDELADQFYESKNIIRQDLEEIQQSLQSKELTLTIQPRIGVQITGNERTKRKVFAQFVKKNAKHQGQKMYLTQFFEPQDLQHIRKVINTIDPNLLEYEEGNTVNNLLLHLIFMIERIKNKASINLSTTEKDIIEGTDAYTKSHQIADQLSSDLGIMFPADEVRYLGLHIASLQMNQQQSTSNPNEKLMKSVTALIKLLVTKVSEILEVDLRQDPYLERNLTLHLESALVRLISGFHIQNPLLQEIKSTYAHLFLVIQFILEEYGDDHDLTFPEEEIGYLTIHFKAALERLEEETEEYRAVITCNYGVGVSSFLEAKIQRSFPEVKIVDLLSAEELGDYPLAESVDLVISTEEMVDLKVPHVVISPMMDFDDQNKLHDFIQKKQAKKSLPAIDLHNYTNTFLIQPKLDIATKEACLSFMCEELEAKGYVNPHYKNSVFEREEKSSTLIAPLVALPHGHTQHVQKSGVFITTLREPIQWGEGEAQLVLLLALRKDDLGLPETKSIFSVLHELTEKPKNLARILSEETPLGILQALSTKNK